MGSSKTVKWVVGTAVLILLILVAAWFLMVTPKLTEASDTRAENDAALAQQDQLRTQLTTLQDQFEKIDEYRAQLDVLHTQIPAEARLAEYTRQLQDAATLTGVTIVALEPMVPEAFGAVADTTSGGTEPAGTTTTDGTTTDGSTTGTATGDAAVGEANDTAATADSATDATTDATADPAAAPTATSGAVLPPELAGMAAVRLSITVVGPYPSVMAFLESVQTVIPRLLLVTGFTGVSQDVADTMSGRPATNAGDLELNLQGFMYYIVPDAAATPVDPDAEPVEPTPLPQTDRNPFSPITG